MSSRKKSRQPMTPDIAIPSLENAAERKRVLNVLAQRRYRQRRTDRLKKLEDKISSSGKAKVLPTTEYTAQDALMTFQMEDQDQHAIFAEDGLAHMSGSSLASATSLGQLGSGDDDISDLPELVASTSYDSSDSRTLMSLQGLSEFSSPESASWIVSSADHGRLRAPVSTYTTPASFYDEAYLPTHYLKIVSFFHSIVQHLNIGDAIWASDAISPFVGQIVCPSEWSHLPANLQPTGYQIAYPHHPLIDVIPWPTVRNKLILALNCPVEMRPLPARSPTALMDFMTDLDDTEEGVRIEGDDPYIDDGWEVGRKVFKDWWWVFDSEIIKRSNRMRKERGALLLGQ